MHLYEQITIVLFEIYEFSCSTGLSDSRSVFGRWNPSLEAEMFVTAVMTVLCMAGIAFYVRFVVALCKECKPHSIGYWVRVRLGLPADRDGATWDDDYYKRERSPRPRSSVLRCGHLQTGGQPHHGTIKRAGFFRTLTGQRQQGRRLSSGALGLADF